MPKRQTSKADNGRRKVSKGKRRKGGDFCSKVKSINNNKNNENEQNPSTWDLSRENSDEAMNEIERSQTLDICKKALKIFFFLLSFILVLSGSVFSQLSIMAVSSNIKTSSSKETRILWHMAALSMLLFPKILMIIKCINRTLKGIPRPSFKLFVIMMITELSGSAGMGLLIFQVLPHMPFILAPLIFLTLGWLPGLLRTIISNPTITNKGLYYLRLILTPLAVLLQITFPVFLYLITRNEDLRITQFYIFTALSIVLISFSWWPSFARVVTKPNKYSHEANDKPIENKHGQRPNNNHRTVQVEDEIYPNEHEFNTHNFKSDCSQSLLHFVKELEKCRYRLYIWISLMQMVVLTIIGLSSLPSDIRIKPQIYQQAFNLLLTFNNVKHYYWVLVSVVSGYLTYIVGRTVCKISMQTESFALPLNLTSVAILILLSVCEATSTNPCYAYIFDIQFDKFVANNVRRILPCVAYAVVLILCQIISGAHVFNPKQDQFSNADNLFITPMYDSGCIVQSLLFNRKDIDSLAEELHEMGQEDKTRANIPKIFFCATMWHETFSEMQQLFISIFRADREVIKSSIMYKNKTIPDPTEYDFEVHIMFDDAFTTRRNKTDPNKWERVVNSYVLDLIDAIKEAAKIVYRRKELLSPPSRVITPYGGQLIWATPGHKPIVVHLKDITKIRNKKRWSQVMYLNYLLQYKMELKMKPEKDKDIIDFSLPFLKRVDEKCLSKLQKTFILTLDGDIDFHPSAIQLLLNRLSKDKMTAATCARIIPKGS
ncbi:unnamed protein product, partial [Didymodactylos carnosus]